MRTIVHLSDIHFGRINAATIEPAVRAIEAIAPDVLAVSGDLTQHAHRREFEKAAAFLARLPGIRITVPGNHDMAFLNPWRRVRQRLKLFRELISADAEPFYSDEEIAVLGLNTARVTHLRDGRIRAWQVRHMEEKMAAACPGAVRILVTHHPFDLPEVYKDQEIVGRGRQFVPRVVKCIDVMLAGHMHISHSGPTALRYEMGGQSAIFVQAGTVLSTRGRGEANAFQVIRTAADAVETTAHAFDGIEFRPQEPRLFRRENGSWRPETHSVSSYTQPSPARGT